MRDGGPSQRGRSATVDPDVTHLLAHGEIAVKRRMPSSSNATFLVALSLRDASALAVYKPVRGERPLWDFPPGLDRREAAAYALSEALGWGLVPLTLRRDGPFGAGSLQLFVHAHFEHHYFTLRGEPEHGVALRRICLFDLLLNNADRKSGHCLLGPDGRIYAVDNGLSFHTDPKLRTVIWEFAGEPIPVDARGAVGRLVDAGVPAAVAELLAPAEREALRRRAAALLAEPCFPADPGYAYPWPLV